MKKISALFILAFFCCNLFAQSNIPSYVPTNGLVAWYPFNGNANDESGNGNNGTVNGSVQFINDRNSNSNQAIQGGNGYINMTNNFFRFGRFDYFTVSVWFTVPSYGCSGRLISTESSEGHFRIGNYGNGNIAVQFGEYMTVNVSPNVWHHLVYTYSNRNEIVYIDGNSVATGYEQELSELLNYSYPFTIGAKASPAYDLWCGNIDDISIYNRAITQQEITALYTGQSSTNVDTSTNNTKSVPPGIPYQAVIRNASGQIMTNANVTAQFTLHKDSAIGAVEYQEVHSLTTNAQGLTNTILGKGTATQGTFTGINWANTNKFLQVQMDLGNGYVDLGTQQLMSVPYAMYAANGPKGEKGEKGDGLKNGSSKGQIMYWDDSAWVTASAGQYGQSLVFCNGVPTWGGCLPKITGIEVSNIYSNIATCGGVINNDGGSAITARGVCWSTNPNPTIDLDTKTYDGSGKGSFTSYMTGLLPLNTYYVRAYATNDLGTVYGEQKIFTTNNSNPETLPNVFFYYGNWTDDCVTDGVQNRSVVSTNPADSFGIATPPNDSIIRICPASAAYFPGVYKITADTLFTKLAGNTSYNAVDIYHDTSWNPTASLDDYYTFNADGSFTYNESGTLVPAGWGISFLSYPYNPVVGFATGWSLESAFLVLDPEANFGAWGYLKKITSSEFVLNYSFYSSTTGNKYIQSTTYTKQP